MLRNKARRLTIDALSDIESEFGDRFLVDPVEGGIDLLGSIRFESSHNVDQVVMHEFALRIWIPSNYPDVWLKVWETDNKIPRAVHKNIDQSLCLGSQTHIRMILNGRYELPTVIRELIAPHLAVCSASSTPSRELAHGCRGLLDDLARIFAIDGENPMTVDERDSATFSLAVLALFPTEKRNALCPCGSGVTVARCHGPILSRLSIGVKQGIYEDVFNIRTDPTRKPWKLDPSSHLRGWLNWAKRQIRFFR